MAETDMTLALDPRVGLATALAAQRGVLGSGSSSGVGVPTGWGVVEALVRRVAAAQGETIDADRGWETWWPEKMTQPLGYSTLLEQLAPTAPARRSLLAGFFEPTEEERAEGQKTPGAAHRAIARLVAKGAIRVIVTTNFDRLVEQALEAEGIMPQVISSENAAMGMEPLQHARATVIKLHGDYASLDQRNTVDELRAHSPAVLEVLRRVLDEYGLIVSGWSGDWDPALASALEQTANRRYPLYWTSRSELNATGKRLTARSGAQAIVGVTAEEFFPDLLARTEAVEALREAPASLQLKVQRLKRALPDPVRHIEVRELFSSELDSLRDWARSRPRVPSDNTYEIADTEFDSIYTRTETLLKLYATGILLDRDRQHTDLWVWVMQEALNIRTMVAGQFVEWWDNLAHYPAFLLLRAGTMAALVAGHEEVIVRISAEPTWSSIFVSGGEDAPAHEVVHLWRVLTNDIVAHLPRWAGTVWSYPPSHLMRTQLNELAVELGRTPDAADKLLSRMEYRMALANQVLRRGSGYFHGAAAGDYLGTWPYRNGEDEQTRFTADFLASGDQAAWGRTSVEDAGFDEKIRALDERLLKIRSN